MRAVIQTIGGTGAGFSIARAADAEEDAGREHGDHADHQAREELRAHAAHHRRRGGAS